MNEEAPTRSRKGRSHVPSPVDPRAPHDCSARHDDADRMLDGIAVRPGIERRYRPWRVYSFSVAIRAGPLRRPGRFILYRAEYVPVERRRLSNYGHSRSPAPQQNATVDSLVCIYLTPTRDGMTIDIVPSKGITPADAAAQMASQPPSGSGGEFAPVSVFNPLAKLIEINRLYLNRERCDLAQGFRAHVTTSRMGTIGALPTCWTLVSSPRNRANASRIRDADQARS